MKRILIIVFVLSLLFACQFEKVNNFTDENGLFSVNFSSEPIYAVDTISTEIGQVILHTFMLEESPTVAKTVTYSDYPKKVLNLDNPLKLLESAKLGALKSLGINNIILDQKIEENGIPGLEIIGTNELGFYIHYKLFLKENRLFQIGLLKEGDNKESKNEMNFIKNFVIL